MKYIINLDTMKVEEYKDGSLPPKKDLADLFAEHRGAKEYEGIVAEIQEWFYG